MKISKVVLSIITLSLIFSCSNKLVQKELTPSESCIPTWYLIPTLSPDTLFAAKQGVSTRMQMAINKATIDARGEIALQLKSKLNTLMKNFEEEVGETDNPTTLQQTTIVTKVLASVNLMGTKPTRIKVCRNEKIFECYVEVSYPLNGVNAQLLNQIKKQTELYTRFRASNAFKELEKAVEQHNQTK